MVIIKLTDQKKSMRICAKNECIQQKITVGQWKARIRTSDWEVMCLYLKGPMPQTDRLGNIYLVKLVDHRSSSCYVVLDPRSTRCRRSSSASWHCKVINRLQGTHHVSEARCLLSKDEAKRFFYRDYHRIVLASWLRLSTGNTPSGTLKKFWIEVLRYWTRDAHNWSAITSDFR